MSNLKVSTESKSAFSYQTKSLAAKLLCISANDNQTADSQLKTESEKKQLLTSDGKKLVVPDWLEKFLSDSSSDRMLVHHIEVWSKCKSFKQNLIYKGMEPVAQ